MNDNQLSQKLCIIENFSFAFSALKCQGSFVCGRRSENFGLIYGLGRNDHGILISSNGYIMVSLGVLGSSFSKQHIQVVPEFILMFYL